MNWNIQDNVLIKYIPSFGETEAVVPAGVTAIAAEAFAECKELISVVLPEGVVEIRDGGRVKGVFRDCKALESVVLPESLTLIGREAFAGCVSLKEIRIPAGVTQIGEFAFYECKSLRDVVIPESVNMIKTGAFALCESLESVQLPASLKRMGEGAYSIFGKWGTTAQGVFEGCTALKEIALPEGMEKVGYSTFTKCKSLKTVEIPQSLTYVTSGMFRGCEGLEKVYLPDSLTMIFGNAFWECTALEEIRIPAGVTELKDNAFADCASLRHVVLPDGLTQIGSRAFSGCAALEEIRIPDGVIKIGRNAFYGCKNLRAIAIPAGVTEIEEDVFSGCRALCSVSMGDRVTRIHWGAFESCSSLEEIELPDSVTQVGFDVFAHCQKLRRVSMPGAQKIDPSAFRFCESLEQIVLAPSVSVDCQWFASENAENRLRQNGLLLTKDGTCIIKAEDKQMEECVIPEGVTHIASQAFMCCQRLQSVTLPDSLTSIGKYAFCECPPESISLPAGLLTIDEYAFVHAMNLSEVIIHGGVKEIGEYAFSRCTALKKVILSDGVKRLGRNAFENCAELENVRIPDTVTQVDQHVFRSCPKLASHILTENIKAIGEYEFDPSGKVDANISKEGYLAPMLRFLPRRTIARLIVFQKGKQVEEQIRKGINESTDMLDFAGVCKCICEEIEAAKGKAFNNATTFFVDYAEHIDAASVRAFVAVLEKKKAKTNLETLSNDAGIREKLSEEAETETAANHPIEEKLTELIAASACGTFVEIRQFGRELKKNKLIPEGLKYADGTAVSENAFAFVLKACMETGECEQAREVVSAFDQNAWNEALGEIARQESYRRDKHLVKLMCLYGQGSLIDALIAVYPKWNTWSEWNKVGRELTSDFMWWICLSSTREALVFADKKGILKRYAETQGADVEEMRSRLLADFGFDEQGVRIFRAGEAEIEASLNPDASVRLFNRATGKVVKSFPKKGAPNDGEVFSAWKKQLATVVKSRTKQLRELFESGETAEYAQWRRENCTNAIYAALARGLVWAVYDGKEAVGTFRLNENLSEADSDGNAVVVAEDAKIGVMHPVDIGADALTEWKEAFAAIAQPLPQLETSVRLPAPDTLQARYMGCMVQPRVLLHGANGYDEEGGVTAGTETVTVTIINRHDFSGAQYPIVDVDVNQKRFANKRCYSTDVLEMDKLLNPFAKALEAVKKGDLDAVRTMVKIELITPDNILSMIGEANLCEQTETAGYLLNLSNEWGIGADDDLCL